MKNNFATESIFKNQHSVPEVVADETSAIDAVLKADTKRLALLEEEKKLMAEAQQGSTKNSTRLQEVCIYSVCPVQTRKICHT